jgi:hypothetical protein
MPVSIVYKYYNPAPLSENVFKGSLLRELQIIRDKMIADFYKTTATWKDHKPQFEGKVQYAQGEASIIVHTGSEIYGYINAGTRVRYATMSNQFTPKTQPRVIGSTPGNGEMAYVSRKVARPGIEARHFTDTIAEKYQPEVANALVIAFNKSLAKGWRSGR